MALVDLIVMDVDGTLLDSCGRLHDDVKQAVQAAADEGITLALGTGRVMDEISELLHELPGVRYAITCTGASVYDLKNHQEIFSDAIPMEMVREIYARVKNIPGVFELMADGHVYADKDRLAKLTENTDGYYLKMVKETRTLVDMEQLLRERTAAVPKAHAIYPTHVDQIEAVQRTADLPLLMLSSIPTNYEFNMPSADKGAGMKALAAYLGIPMRKTMAIGDNTNDIGMLRDAGYPVLMANCNRKILPFGRYMTDSCDNGGIDRILRAVLNGTLETLRIN